MTRLEKLEAVVEAARRAIAEWDCDGEMDVSPMRQALAALDAHREAPQETVTSKTVEVRAVVLVSGSGTWTAFGSDTCDDDSHAERRVRHAFDTRGEQRMAILTARIPLPIAPTVTATVTLPLTPEGGR